MRTLVAVEIADNPLLLLVIGVFLLTFLAVCVIAFIALSKGRRGGEAPTWRLNYSGSVPVSQQVLGRLAEGTRAAMTTAEITPERRRTLDRLDSTRRTLARVNRAILILMGLAGLAGGVMLLRSHTPANMQALPGAIVILLSLYALLSGLPGRADAIEPLSPELRRQMRERIRVDVATPNVTEVRLGEPEIRRMAEIVGAGSSVADALRTVYPSFDALSGAEQRWLESTAAGLIERSTRT